MFWKKKSATLLSVFKDKFVCLGPEYLKESFSDQGDFHDAAKEKLMACISNRELTHRDIEELNSRYEFDLWQGMVWINAPDYKRYSSGIIESPRYRLTDFSASLNQQDIAWIMEYFNFELFYSANDIALVSGIMGRDLLADCHWDQYSKVTLRVEHKQTEYNYYRREIKKAN
jgi:hypothetical protein